MGKICSSQVSLETLPSDFIILCLNNKEDAWVCRNIGSDTSTLVINRVNRYHNPTTEIHSTYQSELYTHEYFNAKITI